MRSSKPERSAGSDLTLLAALAVTVTLAAPALGADTLTLHAYRLAPSGPSASLPAASLLTTIDISRGSARCDRATGARICRGSAAIPEGTVAVVSVLTEKKHVVGEAFAVVDSRGLALDAGAVTIANLVVIPPATIAGRAFNVATTAFAADGSVALLDPARPIDVRVYGPAGVVPSPRATVAGGGVVAPFRYSGRAYVNPMTVTAVAGTMSNTAQIFPHAGGAPACTPLGDTTVTRVDEPASVRRGFGLHASIAGSKVVAVRLDTGSTSLVIAKSKLAGALASQLIGPGRSAQVTYEPSGVTLYGNYYLAPVTLCGNGGQKKLGTTVPMEVFVATTECSKHQVPPCPPDTGTAYMGVGFGRPTPKAPPLPGQPLMTSPLENAFMQLAQIVEGPMHPGFVLSPDDLTIGLDRAAAAGASFVGLSPYPGRRGDWQGPPACLRFDAEAYQCGRMLVDIGIGSMFVHAKRPAQFGAIEIVSPDANRPLLRYTIDPTAVKIAFVGPPEPVFVNTGRDVLAAATFLYDAGCGRAGFRTI